MRAKRLKLRMIMVTHQYMAVDLYCKALRHFRPELDKMFETVLILENLPVLNFAIDHMVPTSLHINSSRARHQSIIIFSPFESSTCCMLRRDPRKYFTPRHALRK